MYFNPYIASFCQINLPDTNTHQYHNQNHSWKHHGQIGIMIPHMYVLHYTVLLHDIITIMMRLSCPVPHKAPVSGSIGTIIALI